MLCNPQDYTNNQSFMPTTTIQLRLTECLTHCNGSLYNTQRMEISFLFIQKDFQLAKLPVKM